VIFSFAQKRPFNQSKSSKIISGNTTRLELSELLSYDLPRSPVRKNLGVEKFTFGYFKGIIWDIRIENTKWCVNNDRVSQELSEYMLCSKIFKTKRWSQGPDVSL
jgi:hypothetical protein